MDFFRLISLDQIFLSHLESFVNSHNTVILIRIWITILYFYVDFGKQEALG